MRGAIVAVTVAGISLCGCNAQDQAQANKSAYEAGKNITAAYMNNGAVQGAAQTVAAAAGGASQAIFQGQIDKIQREQPQWETTLGRSKDECMAISNGVINEAFMRCRHGYQQFVSHKDNGTTLVLQERKIPNP